ncbi:uncharacterized protein LOC131671885 [Phymastichus coffea]|uniref:uncharacterized protein LOC131671885 n=1 Tax=Phymastichus coffea TaxID=108790 RepID=UPI00273B7BE0|nr:uncharacterized protein LOC131671885 [Phymastichus coffea]
MTQLYEGMEKPFLPMLISNWIFGIGIIQYPMWKPRKLFSFIYTSMILSSFLYLTYLSYPYYAFTKVAKMSPITNGMFYYANTAVTISVLVAGWFQSKGLQKCMVSAAVSNSLLRKIGIQRDHSKILKKELFRFLSLAVYILAVITVNCAITAHHRDLKTEEITTMFLQNFPIIVVFIADTSFKNILGYAYYKFESLSDMFQNLLTSTENIPLYRVLANQVFTTNVYSRDENTAQNKDYTFIIKTGKLVHLELVKLCQEGNRTYGFHILTSLVVAFTMMINDIFNIYTSLTYSVSNNIKLKEILRSLNWFLYFFIKTTTNCQFYTTVCQSANRIGDIICELYDENFINANTKEEIRRFNINLVQNKLKLTACGMVIIDLTLIPTLLVCKMALMENNIFSSGYMQTEILH